MMPSALVAVVSHQFSKLALLDLDMIRFCRGAPCRYPESITDGNALARFLFELGYGVSIVCLVWLLGSLLPPRHLSQ